MPEPSDTSASIFGEPRNRLVKPLTKKRWLTTITAPVNRSCSRPMAMGSRASTAGSGQPHMLCPMERYISGSSSASDTISRTRSRGVVRSFRASAADADGVFFSASRKEAP